MRLLTRAPTMVLAAVAALAAISPVHTARAAGNIIVGTTDTVNTLDPAKCYNYYCSNILHNVAQTLVTYPPDSTELTPDLAKAMPKVSDGGLTYTFELKQGVTFQDGSALTSEDVKFSLNRSLWMNHPEGAGFLLSGIESIDTPDDHRVVIHLKSPDITFVSKLAYVEATILPSDAYTSPDSPIPNDARRATYEQYVNEDLIGSGPYRIANFRENQSLLLETWDGYAGEAPRNDKVLVRFFSKSSQMLVAMKSGEIDVAFRHFTPEQRESLNQADDIQTIEGEGASIRYLVFNPNLEPGGNKKVRQAVAAALDRQRIIDNALGGAAEPLYSLVPPAFADASPAFDKLYGAKKAADYLDEKVELTLWYSRGHYGDTEPSLAQTIARTLEETGLFDVELQSSEWAQFTASAYPGSSGQYAAFLMGWYPDYLDPDNYLAPFYHSTESFLRVYDNPRMDELLDSQRTADAPDAAPRSEAFANIQRLAAEDAPIVPLYVITPFAFAREGISGVEEIMGAAQIFRYDRLSKSGG